MIYRYCFFFLIMISLSKFLPDIQFLFTQVLSLAVENTRSTESEDAGMHNKSTAILLISG